MKLWTMPKIVVDVFTPNDSVAVCKSSQTVHPVDLGNTTLYWDYITPLGISYTYNRGEDIDISGNEFDPPDSLSHSLQTVSFYYDIHLGVYYYWETVTYDVWVISDDTAYIYESDMLLQFLLQSRLIGPNRLYYPIYFII